MLGGWDGGVPSGGVGVHVSNLASHLSEKRDIEIYYVSFGKSSSFIRSGNLRIILIKSHRLLYLLPFVALGLLGKELRKIHADCIHVHGANVSPYLFYALFFCASDTRRIVTFHSITSEERIAHGKISRRSVTYRFLRALERLTCRKFDSIITVTERLKERICLERICLDPTKVVSIPNGVDIQAFTPMVSGESVRKELGITSETFVILHAKAFVVNNGQEYLIRAMPKILSRIPGSKLILAGRGPLMNCMIQLSKDLGVWNNVIFIGGVSHSFMPSYIAAADVVVVPSVTEGKAEEGSSVFLIESMASGKPVVATNVGGNAEAIQHGFNGLLIHERDSEAIVEALFKVHSDVDLREYLSRNAVAFAQSQRTWDSIADITSRQYEPE